MTKVTYLHGIPRQQAWDEAADRAAGVSKRAPNFSVLGNDRAAGALLLHQLQIFKDYYPERPELKRAYEYARYYLQHGSGKTVGTSDIERQVAKELARLKPGRPAVGSVEAARNAYFAAILAGGQLPDIRGLCRHHNPGLINSSRGKCRDELGLLADASDKLYDAAYHMLYEFSPATISESAVITKRILHKAAIGALAEITRLSRKNMNRWIRAGIMQGTVNAQGPPLQPEESIDELRAALAAGDRIGALPIVAILGAITAAIGAATGLILSLSDDAMLLRNNATGFGNESFGPERTDFFSAGSTNGQSNFLIPLLLAGGGFLLLNQK